MGGVGEGRRVTVRCDRENGCPLYRKGDRIEFDDVTVNGADNAPVCAQAVTAVLPSVDRVRAGDAPWNHDGATCGGCVQGEAWFTFRSSIVPRAASVTPRFEAFALETLAEVKALEGVPRPVLRRLVPYLHERAVEPGEIIVRAGSRPVALSMIVEGRFLVIARTESGQERSVMTLSRGHCIGGDALLSGEPAEVTIAAWGKGRLLEAARGDFAAVLTAAPPLALNLARDAIRRRGPAEPARNAWTRGGLGGTLEAIAPAELVQTMHGHGHTGLLTLERDAVQAQVYFEGGEVVDARLGGDSGPEAFFACLRWVRGDFRFEPGRRTGVRTIERGTIGLLLEGARRLDESTRPVDPV